MNMVHSCPASKARGDGKEGLLLEKRVGEDLGFVIACDPKVPGRYWRMDLRESVLSLFARREPRRKDGSSPVHPASFRTRFP
jgi:hypothetical protein